MFLLTRFFYVNINANDGKHLTRSIHHDKSINNHSFYTPNQMMYRIDPTWRKSLWILQMHFNGLIKKC
jgi:hypothetical protein